MKGALEKQGCGEQPAQGETFLGRGCVAGGESARCFQGVERERVGSNNARREDAKLG